MTDQTYRQPVDRVWVPQEEPDNYDEIMAGQAEPMWADEDDPEAFEARDERDHPAPVEQLVQSERQPVEQVWVPQEEPDNYDEIMAGQAEPMWADEDDPEALVARDERDDPAPVEQLVQSERQPVERVWVPQEEPDNYDEIMAGQAEPMWADEDDPEAFEARDERDHPAPVEQLVQSERQPVERVWVPQEEPDNYDEIMTARAERTAEADFASFVARIEGDDPAPIGQKARSAHRPVEQVRAFQEELSREEPGAPSVEASARYAAPAELMTQAETITDEQIRGNMRTWLPDSAHELGARWAALSGRDDSLARAVRGTAGDKTRDIAELEARRREMARREDDARRPEQGRSSHM